METLEIVQILEKKDFDHDEARRLAEAINGNAALKAEFEAFKLQLDKKISRGDYKKDLDEIKKELKDFIDTKLRAEREIIEANIGKQLIEQKADTDRQLSEMRADTDRQLSEMRADTDRQFAKVDIQLSEMKADTDRQFAKVDTRLSEMKADTDRQFTGMKADTDRQFNEIKAKMETNQKWLMGLGIMLLGAILATNLPDLLKAFG